METIANFLGAHWVIFLVIVILLIFALIGYLVDSNSIEEDDSKTIKLEDIPKEPSKVEDVEVLSTVSETLDNNQEQQSKTREEIIDESIQSNESITTNDEMQPLIQEENSDVSTFQG